PAHTAVRNPAPDNVRSSRIRTVNPRGRPFKAGSGEREDGVLAIQMGKRPQPSRAAVSICAAANGSNSTWPAPYTNLAMVSIFSSIEAPSSYKRRKCDGRSHAARTRSEEHTSELQSRVDLVCRLLLEKKKMNQVR